ncbi:hypothetical protein [Castellaniella ginsengisoli]|uniref:Uncharacterized protein n=1 Tax=Castellaniella ginsengisoli TaxID=546114 RepID=A0AB39FNF8_9BURK
MALGLENFRQLGSGIFEREIRQNPQGQEGVRQSGLSRLAGRIQGWFRSPQEQQARVQERIQVKQAFLGLLEKTEGQAGALRALRACGLPRDWANNDRPLTNHQIGKILNKAQEYRLQVVRHNESLLGQTLRGLEGPELRDERAAVIRAVRNDSRYGNTPLSRTDVQSLRTRAETELRELRAGQCGERFPELTQLIQDAPRAARCRGSSSIPRVSPKACARCMAVARGMIRRWRRPWSIWTGPRNCWGGKPGTRTACRGCPMN